MGNTTLVTGGSGYIGALLVEELRENGHEVRVLDSLLHGQEDIAAEQEQAGVEVIRARHPRRRRARSARSTASTASSTSPRSSATRPAGATPSSRTRSTSQATAGLVADAGEAGVQRLVFASTCSNYGRMADPTVPITEDGELSPVSLYAEQKVSMEKLILGGGAGSVETDLPALRDRLRRRAGACAST